MKDVIIVGNIDFVKILAVKYGNDMPIGEIIHREENLNESKLKRAVPGNRPKRYPANGN